MAMQGWLQNFRVLVVEDDPLVSETIASLLHQAGHFVAGCAYNGEQAVEMTQKLKPDVVLMDLNMPMVDGIEATQQIMLACPTPVVVLTAYDNQEFVTRATNAQVAAYLVKPPRIQELNRVMTVATARFADMMTLKTLNTQLTEALQQVKTLSGLLPICASCKKIRDDEGYWNQVEEYLQRHTELKFTHGVCPTCAQQLYGEFIEDDDLD